MFFVFEFGNRPEIAAGAKITAAVITGPTVAITNQQFNDYSCGATITGGISSIDYAITANVSLSDGSIINPQGNYRVRT